MTNDIYQHFRPNERMFIDKALDWVRKVSEDYSVVTTNFLNPRETYILETIVNKYADEGLQFFSSSIIVETEYNKVILAPSYYLPVMDDFEISCLQISFTSKFVTLKHSQILGALLGETGIERLKIGDIAIHDSFAQVLVDQKMATVMIENVKKIGNSGVKIKEIKPVLYHALPEKLTSKTVTMSSLRLDKTIACVFNMSRSIAQKLIQSKKVKVNYSEVQQNDFELVESDLLSVRGFGRIKIVQNLGLTKKDKLRIEVQILSNK